jgi:hypothetical protein
MAYFIEQRAGSPVFDDHVDAHLRHVTDHAVARGQEGVVFELRTVFLDVAEHEGFQAQAAQTVSKVLL